MASRIHRLKTRGNPSLRFSVWGVIFGFGILRCELEGTISRTRMGTLLSFPVSLLNYLCRRTRSRKKQLRPGWARPVWYFDSVARACLWLL